MFSVKYSNELSLQYGFVELPYSKVVPVPIGDMTGHVKSLHLFCSECAYSLCAENLI